MTDGPRGGGGTEGGTQAERFWEAHYRRHERVFSGKANPLLVDLAQPLPPGTALDLGCGEGGMRSGSPGRAGA